MVLVSVFLSIFMVMGCDEKQEDLEVTINSIPTSLAIDSGDYVYLVERLTYTMLKILFRLLYSNCIFLLRPLSKIAFCIDFVYLSAYIKTRALRLRAQRPAI